MHHSQLEDSQLQPTGADVARHKLATKEMMRRQASNGGGDDFGTINAESRQVIFLPVQVMRRNETNAGTRNADVI